MRRCLDQTALWRVGLGCFWLIWLVFPGTLIVVRRVVLESWSAEDGFLLTMSVSPSLIKADSLLCVVATLVLLMLIKDHRDGKGLWLDWMKQGRTMVIVVTLAAMAVWWFLMVRNQRPMNSEVIHNYAWVYDGYHLIVATLMAVWLVYGGLAWLSAWCDPSRRTSLRHWLVYPLLLLMVGVYFQIALAGYPAYKLQPGIRVGGAYLQPITNRLFHYPDLEGVELLIDDP